MCVCVCMYVYMCVSMCVYFNGKITTCNRTTILYFEVNTDPAVERFIQSTPSHPWASVVKMSWTSGCWLYIVRHSLCQQPFRIQLTGETSKPQSL